MAVGIGPEVVLLQMMKGPFFQAMVHLWRLDDVEPSGPT